MTEKKRIFLNIVATYGRSLAATICGIFSSRWALMALGQEDYGHYAVIGGMTGFIMFFNHLFSMAVSRYFAYSIGQSRSEDTVEICRQWFNTALVVHTVLPSALIIISYPIGVWAVENWLTIPPDRVVSCVWLFRIVCVSCFVGMVNVPFQAMYVAKQYIAELTIYSLAGTFANVGVLAYMVAHPRNWLIPYAVAMCLIAVVPQFAICLRASHVFPECRIKTGYFFSRARFKRLLAFVGWQFIGNFGMLCKTQGLVVLVNKFFGPVYNATMGIANTIAGHTGTLAASMQGAFSPAVTTAMGAGAKAETLRMTYLTCKFGMILTLVVLLPLSIELDCIIPLWLKNPPPYVYPASLLTLCALAIDSANTGIGIAVSADGRIGLYNLALGLLNVSILPLVWLSAYLWPSDFVAIFILLALSRIIFNFIGACLARKLLHFSLRVWLFDGILRIAVAAAVSLSAGCLVRMFFAQGIPRLCVNAILVGGVFSVCAFFLVLKANEREFFVFRFGMLKNRVLQGAGRRHG